MTTYKDGSFADWVKQVEEYGTRSYGLVPVEFDAVDKAAEEVKEIIMRRGVI